MSKDLDDLLASERRAHAENERLRQSIRALIEIYAPEDRKTRLLFEHLKLSA